MAGQNHHFVQYAPEKIRYAMERYVKETNRLYGVLDRRLVGREFPFRPDGADHSADRVKGRH
jgi:GSH-dependent disulfide-bond oxidoreductase